MYNLCLWVQAATHIFLVDAVSDSPQRARAIEVPASFSRFVHTFLFRVKQLAELIGWDKKNP